MDDKSVKNYEAFLEAQLEAANAKAREMQSALEKMHSDRDKLQTQLDGVREWLATNSSSSTVDENLRADSQARQEDGVTNDGAHVDGTKPTGAAKQRRASKNQPIFDAFEAAGSQGLSQEEVLEVASKNGLLTNRDALRALCWSAKQAGRLISIAPGRYAIAPKNEAAADNSTEGEAAASTDHNQHREGDAGGGI